MRNLLLLSAVLVACNEPSKLERSVGKGTAAAGAPFDANQGAAPFKDEVAPAPEVHQEQSGVPAPAESPVMVSNPIESTLAPEAQAPGVIAGAFLQCSPTVSSKVACYVLNEKREKIKLPGPVQPDVYFISSEAKLAKKKVAYSTIGTNLSPTLYVLDLSSKEVGTIELYMDRTNHISFNSYDLAGATPMADLAVDTNVTALGGKWDSGTALGDKIMSVEKDPCLASTAAEFKVDLWATSARFAINPTTSAKTDLYLMGLCGLQTTDALAVIKLAGVPQYYVSLPPIVSGNLKLATGYTFNANSSYTVWIENPTTVAGDRDDFSFVDLAVSNSSDLFTAQ